MLVAVIALSGTFVGYQASVQTLNAQVAAQQGAEQRGKKPDAYFAFLAANYSYMDLNYGSPRSWSGRQRHEFAGL
ncbi:hypothetical protein [Pseudonocardia adelaidensis]|uniref:hypothetical protein n=1 Tax=Pseudonocardia adelaidensis TaxID=648754 RepID=UPI0031F02A97